MLDMHFYKLLERLIDIKLFSYMILNIFEDN